MNALKSRYPPEGALLSRLRLAVHQTLRFPMSQRRHVTNPYNNPMFFVHSFYYFSKSHWRPHFSYGFDMTSTCCTSCDPTKLTKITVIPFLHIFPIDFEWFYVSIDRPQFCKIRKLATDLSQHEALKVAHVHEMTLCVTFGALHFRNHFCFVMPC